MALAADDFDDLFDSMGLAGTAAANLEDVLKRVASAETEAARIAKLAADSGKSVAQVRSAIAQAAAAQAAAVKAAAAEQIAAVKALAEAQKIAAAEQKAAASEAAAAAKTAATEQAARDKAIMAESLNRMKVQDNAAAEKAKANEAADKAIMAENLNRMKVLDDAAAAQKTNLSTSGGEAAESQGDLNSMLMQIANNSVTATGTIGKLQGALSKLGPTGAAVAVGIGVALVVVTALATALSKLAMTAIAATQAKARIVDAMGALQGTGAAGGGVLVRQLDELSKKLPFTAGQLQAWARPLLALRMPAQDVEGALKAIAAATALMGEEGGAAAKGLYEELQKLSNMRQRAVLSPDMQAKLAAAGVSAKVLAAELGTTEDRLRFLAVNAKDLGDVMQRVLLRQGAGALAAMGQSWDTITAKVREGITDAFADLGDVVNPFMKEVQGLAAELFKGSAGAGIIAAVVRGVLRPAFSAATDAVRFLHIALLYVEIYGLKAFIALDAIGAVALAAWAGMYLLKGTLAVLGVVLGVVALAAALIALPFVIFGVAVFAVATAIQYLIGVFAGAVNNFDNLKAKVTETASGIAGSIVAMLASTIAALAALPKAAAMAGLNFVLGLVGSISSGAGAVAEAVKNLAKSAISAITGAFQTRSPSRLTQKIGGYFDEGLEGGIDEGAGDVADAAQGVGDAAVGGLGKGLRSGGKGAKGKGEGGGRTFAPVFTNCTFGAGLTETMLRDWMSRWWEEMNASGPEPEPAT